jgi:2-oxoglutarate dehydrogenase E1 component
MPDQADRTVTLPDPANLAFVEDLYLAFLADPGSVPPAWRAYLETVRRDDAAAPRLRSGPSFRPPALFQAGDGSATAAAGDVDRAKVEQDRVDRLMRTYLVRGHLVAAIDPLERPRPALPELEPAFWGFAEADLDRRFSTHGMPGADLLPLREIVARLRATYCGAIGAHFMHIHDRRRRLWLRERMESTGNRVVLSRQGPRASRWKAPRA